MNNAKIRLSEDELHVALNADFILTKNRIIQKVYQLFGNLAESYRVYAEPVFSFLPVPQHPKITRGENYNELPYVVLDYPRYFSHSDILAVRTMFWWGNDMSITLHLKGKYKEMFYAAMISEIIRPGYDDWYLQAQGDEWQHHHTDSTHIPVKKMGMEALQNLVETSSFIKLCNFLPLEKWNEAEDILAARFRQLTNAVSV